MLSENKLPLFYRMVRDCELRTSITDLLMAEYLSNRRNSIALPRISLPVIEAMVSQRLQPTVPIRLPCQPLRPSVSAY